MDKCLVSVIIPVYHVNKQVFLNCIRSLIGQTEKKIEIIVVFDGTKRVYEDILNDPIFGDARLRMIDQAHRGVSAARNRGLDEAVGEWIFFADADDCLSHDAIEHLLEGTFTQADFVIGDYSIKYPQNTVAHSYKKEAFQISLENKLEFLEDILNPQSGMGFCWGKLYRRDCICGHKLRFQESLEVAEDAEFVLQYALQAKTIYYLPGTVYFYQMNPFSAVRKFREDYADQYEKSMQCILHTIMENGYEAQLKQAFETCVLYHFLLITVNYSFHPGQKKGKKQQIADYKKLTKLPLYAEAIHKGNSRRFSLTRRITVYLIRLHFWEGVYAVAWIRHKQLKF